MAMDWDKLRVFHVVAEAGSFTHAGEKLNLSQSAVSRQISALEDSIRAPLFHRHARGLIPTEQGEILYKTVHDVFGKLAMTEAKLSETRGSPQGRLAVTATVAFGSVWLTPRIRGFLTRYPDIEVSLMLADTELDLSMRQADVAIRMTPPTQADLVQRSLMVLHYNAYASPEYIAKHGEPETVEDLDNHSLVVYGEDSRPNAQSLNWLLVKGAAKGRRREPVLRVNSTYGIMRAVQSGLGIGALPNYMRHDTANLTRVLPDVIGRKIEAFFVYPDELRHSARINAFRDFLIAEIGKEKLY